MKKHKAAGTTPLIYGDDEARFQSKLSAPNENGCILWAGTKWGNGYGQFGLTTKDKAKVVAAHRYAYQRANGPIPPGAIIHHKCHVRACVNPDHLVKASHSDNLIESAVVIQQAAAIRQLENELRATKKENKKLLALLKNV